MKMARKYLSISGVLLFGLLAMNCVVKADLANKPTQEEFTRKVQKLQLPFIANEGQADERVKFYAKHLKWKGVRDKGWRDCIFFTEI